MKVKSPHTDRDWLTPNKEYEVTGFDGIHGWITADDGTELFIDVKACIRLNWKSWNIVSEDNEIIELTIE